MSTGDIRTYYRLQAQLTSQPSVNEPFSSFPTAETIISGLLAAVSDKNVTAFFSPPPLPSPFAPMLLVVPRVTHVVHSGIAESNLSLCGYLCGAATTTIEEPFNILHLRFFRYINL